MITPIQSLRCTLILMLSSAYLQAGTLPFWVQHKDLTPEEQILKIEQLTEENEVLKLEIKQLKVQHNILLQQIDSLSSNIETKDSREASNKAVLAKDHPLEQAQLLYQNKQYLQVINLLKYTAFGSDQSPETQDAMYLLSLSHQQLRHCEAAIDIGKRFVEIFPSHINAANALYNVATCQIYLQQKDIAKDTLKQILVQYPDSNAAKRAKSKLK